MGLGRRVSGIAALLVLFFFFLPWVSVSCGSNTLISISGYDLAAGKEIFGERIDGDVVLYLIPLAGLAAAGFAILSRSAWLFKGGQVLSAAVGLAAFGIKLLSSQQGAGGSRSSGLDISIEVGLWGTVGGLLLMFVAAALPSGGPDPPISDP
jgi:hypothetical protein